MASLIPGYEYDIFISYRQKDNKYDGWVTEFVDNLKKELEATFKEEISVYFDINPRDGLLETHDVDASLKEKLKCLVFIPIISRTYCDPKSFAWEYEFKAFIEQASKDQYGLKVKLPGGNVTNRVLPVQIHDLDADDKKMVESELGGFLRGIEFIYKESGVNRPLMANEDHPDNNLNKTFYRNQINKVANAIKEIITGLKNQDKEGKEYSTGLEGKPSGRINQRTKILAGVLIVLALVVAGYFIVPKLFKPSEELEKSIAVLPFINDSPEAGEENTPFVNGLMEEILINLQTIKEFRIPGRTSVEQYRNNTDKSLPDIARELGVNYIIEGSVQKYGNTFRLRVQLIRAKGKEAHLWAKSYEQEIKETKNIFNIQSQIAQAIASELKTVISPEVKQLIEKTSTTNLDAYYFYQRGKEEYTKYLLDNTNMDALNKAERFYHQALKNDPTYAQAFTGLAMVYWEKHFDQEYFSKNFMDSVRVLANKALDYDNNLAEAYYLKGNYYKAFGNYEQALEEYEKALSINPNYWQAYYGEGNLYGWYLRDYLKSAEKLSMAEKLNHDKELPNLLKSLAFGFDVLGFPDIAKEYYDKALKLDGDSIAYFNDLSFLESRHENYLEAIELIKKCQASDSNRLYFRRLGDYYMELGQKDIALKYYKKFIASTGISDNFELQSTQRTGYAYWICGLTKEAEHYFDLQKKYCEESINLNREYAQNAMAYYDLAALYAFGGEKGKAYENLHLYNDKIGENESLGMLWYFKNDPLLDSIRNETKFQEIYREIEAKYKKIHEAMRKYLEEQGML